LDDAALAEALDPASSFQHVDAIFARVFGA